MTLCLTNGNYHIFKLMLQSYTNPAIRIKDIHQDKYDLVFDVLSKLALEDVINILQKELRFSPYMYLCPLYKVIPYIKKEKEGMYIKDMSKLSFQ